MTTLRGKSIVQLSSMFSAVAVFALLGFMPQARLFAQSTGDVYVLSNQAEENSVIVFHRNADGTVERAGSFSTGGSGFGRGPNPLQSQGSLILSADNRMLFAVNAGSDSIAAFSVSGDKLTRLQTVSSGGSRPVSLAVSHDVLYVLNAGGESPNITGFRIVPESAERTLVPIEGSTQALADGSAAKPAEVSFAPDGRAILVTEAGTNQIVSFVVTEEGQTRTAATSPSSGIGPFGLAFAAPDLAVAAHTANGASEEGSMGSYRVANGGQVVPVSPAVNDQGTASTWASVTGSGRIAFTSNAMSGTISSFAISPESGSLTLTEPVAASLRSEDGSLFPAGMALSNNSRYLYVRNGANGTVSGFVIHPDGTLTPVAHAGGLPETAAGIAAR